MRILRKIFLVPLANDRHGKTTMIRGFVCQGEGRWLDVIKKCERVLRSPSGSLINSYIFGRSFQEVEKPKYKTVLQCLDASCENWRDLDLIVMPSHVNGITSASPESVIDDDIEQMRKAGHSAGFDVICASVLLPNEAGRIEWTDPLTAALSKPWDERWTIRNDRSPEPDGQLEALGRELWFRVSGALEL